MEETGRPSRSLPPIPNEAQTSIWHWPKSRRRGGIRLKRVVF
jgi:hypothetical protein